MKLNQFIGMGRLVRDFEVVKFTNGNGVLKSGIAINRDYKKGEEWVKKTCFVDISVLFKSDKAANYICQMVKGDEVVVVGELDMDQWETAEGEKRSKIFLSINSIQKVPGGTPVAISEDKPAKKSSGLPKGWESDDDMPAF